MKRMSPEAKVGLLVLAGLLILIYMSLKVGKIGFGPGDGYVVRLQLDNAVGLAREGQVLVAGIPVGLVEDIRLEDGRATLGLRIRDDVRLPVDSVASLRTLGVLGEKYVEIQPGTSQRALDDGDSIQAGVPPGDLDLLVTRINEISADVKRVTERLANVLGTPQGEEDLRELLVGFRDAATGLREIVEENREALRISLENVSGLTEDLRDMLLANRENLDASIGNVRRFSETLADRTPSIAENLETLVVDLQQIVSENRENLTQSLANLRGATARFSSTLETVESLVEAAGSKEGTLGRLIREDALYEDLQGTLGDLRAVLDRLNRGEGTLGKLLTDDTAYAELTGSLENLRTISEKINRGEGTIGKLVNEESVHENLNETLEGVGDFVTAANRFQFELGYRGEYGVDRGSAKSYINLEIRPRQDRFYHFAVVDDPENDDDDLEFSAQVGKRFSFLTLRGGILESSGGVGADMDFWADRLRLTFEAFDFDRDEGGPPHLKLAARWTLLKHIFVTAGLDDFIDTKGREDFFVGGGIQFLDEDLKFLLSPAASLAR